MPQLQKTLGRRVGREEGPSRKLIKNIGDLMAAKLRDQPADINRDDIADCVSGDLLFFHAGGGLGRLGQH